MRIRRVFKWTAIVFGVLIFALLLASAANQLVTPTRSQMVERLSEAEKARILEVFHLRKTLGDELWSGWGAADIPLIVYNEEYAFLIGYPNPPSGWLRVPQGKSQGGAWEVVPDDTLQGTNYYRQRLRAPNETPQNFVVMVGGRWVASLQTKEWFLIALGNSFQESLPTVLGPIFPRGFVAQLFVGSTDQYIALALHESWHAYQGMVAPARLAEAENATKLEKEYPFGDRKNGEAWQAEMNVLAQGVRASSEEEAKLSAQQFLAERDARRRALGLSTALADYEQKREWLEGLAKYTEVQVWRLAAEAESYHPVPTLAGDADFKQYRGAEENWTREVNQITLTRGSDEVRFYYSGMAQAMLLDRLAPGWKARILSEDMTPEDLLRQATKSRAVSSAETAR